MAVVTSFTSDISVGAFPLPVQFTDTSTGSPDHWWWDFGDGSVGSSSQNPSHTYLCAGTFSVTLTAWIETGVVTIQASQVSTELKTGSGDSTEAAAWTGFNAASFADYPPKHKFNFKFRRDTSAVYKYLEYNPTERIDLTPYSVGEKIILLQYRYRFFIQAISCTIPDTEEFWVSNNKLNEIPILKFCCTGGSFVTTPIQMISAPDLLSQFEHAGELFDIELINGKIGVTPLASEYSGLLTQGDIFALYQQSSEIYGVECINADIDWQRIGLGCIDNPSIGGTDFGREVEFELVEATIHSFSSQDSTVSAAHLTVSSNIIQKPSELYSGIKEAFFGDGWEKEKYFYIEQSGAYPCTVQFVDLYAETENEE